MIYTNSSMSTTSCGSGTNPGPDMMVSLLRPIESDRPLGGTLSEVISLPGNTMGMSLLTVEDDPDDVDDKEEGNNRFVNLWLSANASGISVMFWITKMRIKNADKPKRASQAFGCCFSCIQG
jgi:hypothetical protein